MAKRPTAETQQEYRQRIEIYALSHPVTNEIRYIGKANDSHKRLKTHIRDSRRRKTPVYNWFRKLAEEGLTPTVTVIAVCDDISWKETEIALIAEYSKKHKLLNLAIGGDEPYCSKEQRAINGRNVARSIHDDTFKKKVWELKKGIADDLRFFKKRGMVDTYNKIVNKLKTAAIARPDLFGKFLYLQEI